MAALQDPSKTLTLTNLETGEHLQLSFSDVAHRLNTNVRVITQVLQGKQMAEFTAHHMEKTDYLIKRI